MKIFIQTIIFSLLLGNAVAENVAPNTHVQSFIKSKKILLEKVYFDHRTTFYCGSSFTNKKRVVHDGGYSPKKPSWKRAYRLEWEHVVPAHAFGHNLPEWENGHPECVSSKGKSFKGRKCAEKMNESFRYMQADMHNLVPAIGEINGLRSNYPYGFIDGEKREFGACDMEIENKTAEPPVEIRGNIARTYFYMNTAYPEMGIINKANECLFKTWDQEDPVDAWECERQKRIKAWQGNENPFVEKRCDNQ